MTSDVSVPGLSLSFTWLTPPQSSLVDGDDAVIITAQGSTDLFVDPDRSAVQLNAPCLLADPPPGDWMLSAHVNVQFARTYDAGVLVLWSDDHHWAKLCFEFSPQDEPTIVSVVTRGSSDDCNSFAVDDRSVWLRLARIGTTYAFHASTEGSFWRLIRYFSLDAAQEPRLGLSAQSPLAGGCTVTFRSLAFEMRRLADIRSGE